MGGIARFLKLTSLTLHLTNPPGPNGPGGFSLWSPVARHTPKRVPYYGLGRTGPPSPPSRVADDGNR